MGAWKPGEKVTGAFSPCGQYRYTLRVKWPARIGQADACLIVIGLNPSKADLERDDNTVRKLVNWATRNGFNSLLMLNAFPFRATDPRDMKAASKPEGYDTPWSILCRCADSRPIIAAWGTHGKHRGRAAAIAKAFREVGIPLHCFGVNQDGSPLHPCYARLGELRRWS